VVEFFFFGRFMDQAAGEVHKLAKKEEDQYSPIRTEQASSLLSIHYYDSF